MSIKRENTKFMLPAAEGIDAAFIANAQEWLSTHCKLAKALCNPADALPDNLLSEELHKAVSQGDYAYYALLIYQQSL